MNSSVYSRACDHARNTVMHGDVQEIKSGHRRASTALCSPHQCTTRHQHTRSSSHGGSYRRQRSEKVERLGYSIKSTPPISSGDVYTITTPIPVIDTSSSGRAEQPTADPPAAPHANATTESVSYAADTYDDDSDSFSDTDMRPAAIKSRSSRIARRKNSRYRRECEVTVSRRSQISRSI